jgi:hypothetical protein
VTRTTTFQRRRWYDLATKALGKGACYVHIVPTTMPPKQAEALTRLYSSINARDLLNLLNDAEHAFSVEIKLLMCIEALGQIKDPVASQALRDIGAHRAISEPHME